MKFLRSIAALSILSIILFSCQKEVSFEDFGGSQNTNSGLIGNWKFISMHVQTNVEDELTDGVDVVSSRTVSDYMSFNNQGLLKIDASNMQATDMSYEVDTEAMIYFYENGALVDSLSFPFNFALPPTSSTSAYQLISADSIYFPNGSIVGDPNTGQPGQPTIPSGSRYKINGKTLTFTTYYTDKQKEEDQGITETVTVGVKQVVEFEKQ